MLPKLQPLCARLLFFLPRSSKIIPGLFCYTKRQTARGGQHGPIFYYSRHSWYGCCRSFDRSRLQRAPGIMQDLPGRLHALSNEVSDIELVLYQVASVVEKRTGDSAFKEQEAHIQHLLDQAGSKLGELRTIVETLTDIVKMTKIPILRAHAWRKNQPRLQALQEDIKTVKCSLNIMLVVSNSQDMIRIRVDLENISTVSSNSAQIQLGMEENLQSSLVRHRDDMTEFLTHIYQQVDRRIGNVEELLKVQAVQMQASQLNQLGNLYGRRPSYSRPPPPARKQIQHQESRRLEDIGMRVTQYGACRPRCSCRCHVQRRSSTPGLVDRFFGQMFVGYAGLPLVNAKCDINSCEKNQAAHVSVEYWFPLGFVWSKILRLQLTYQPNIGPQFDLSTLRRVPDSAQCVNFALNGNIDGLKDLFKRGLASPGMSAPPEDILCSDGLCTENNTKPANFCLMLGPIRIIDLSLRLIIVRGTKRTNSYSWAASPTMMWRHSDA